MKWKKSRVGGCYAVIADVINIEVYKSFASNSWVYTLCNRKSVYAYKTMKEAKKEAISYYKNMLANGLAELEKGSEKL